MKEWKPEQASEYDKELPHTDVPQPVAKRQGFKRSGSRQQDSRRQRGDKPTAKPLVPENPERDIRFAAMNLLAHREQSYHELLTKLLSKFSKSEHHPQHLIEEQLSHLRDEGVQCDERFVEAFVNSKKNSGKGPMAIRQLLQQKGLANDLSALALARVEEQWFDLAEQLYQRKYYDKPISDQKEKARRMRFMQRRGFSFDHFMSLIS